MFVTSNQEIKIILFAKITYACSYVVKTKLNPYYACMYMISYTYVVYLVVILILWFGKFSRDHQINCMPLMSNL